MKKSFLDTNSINIYAKLQVSRFNGVARMVCAQTHRHTEVLNPEYHIRASAFQASACDMSGPIIMTRSSKAQFRYDLEVAAVTNVLTA